MAAAGFRYDTIERRSDTCRERSVYPASVMRIVLRTKVKDRSKAFLARLKFLRLEPERNDCRDRKTKDNLGMIEHNPSLYFTTYFEALLGHCSYLRYMFVVTSRFVQRPV